MGELFMYHIVYLTTNLINNKIYVGKQSTYNLNDGYLGSGKYLLRAIKKYGKENFKRDILFYCLSETDAYFIENSIVDIHFINRDDSYNIKCGGKGGMLGCTWTDEAKQIASINKKGIPKPNGFKEKLSIINKGKTLSDECKRKLSEANIGKKQSQETINKKNMKAIGSKRSEETKLKMSLATKTRPKQTKFFTKAIKIYTLDINSHIIKTEEFESVLLFKKTYNISTSTYDRHQRNSNLIFTHNGNFLKVEYI
jgi:group I intron endonuclease